MQRDLSILCSIVMSSPMRIPARKLEFEDGRPMRMEYQLEREINRVEETLP